MCRKITKNVKYRKTDVVYASSVFAYKINKDAGSYPDVFIYMNVTLYQTMLHLLYTIIKNISSIILKFFQKNEFFDVIY